MIDDRDSQRHPADIRRKQIWPELEAEQFQTVATTTNFAQVGLPLTSRSCKLNSFYLLELCIAKYLDSFRDHDAIISAYRALIESDIENRALECKLREFPCIAGLVKDVKLARSGPTKVKLFSEGPLFFERD